MANGALRISNQTELIALVAAGVAIVYLAMKRGTGAPPSPYIPVIVIPGLTPGTTPYPAGTCAGCTPGSINGGDPGQLVTPNYNNYCSNNPLDPICLGYNPDLGATPVGGAGDGIFGTLPGGASGPIVLTP